MRTWTHTRSSAHTFVCISLLTASRPCNQSWSKYIKWKIPGVNNSQILMYTVFWVVWLTVGQCCCVLPGTLVTLFPGYLCCTHFLPMAYFVAVLSFGLTFRYRHTCVQVAPIFLHVVLQCKRSEIGNSDGPKRNRKNASCYKWKSECRVRCFERERTFVHLFSTKYYYNCSVLSLVAVNLLVSPACTLNAVRGVQ